MARRSDNPLLSTVYPPTPLIPQIEWRRVCPRWAPTPHPHCSRRVLDFSLLEDLPRPRLSSAPFSPQGDRTSYPPLSQGVSFSRPLSLVLILIFPPHFLCPFFWTVRSPSSGHLGACPGSPVALFVRLAFWMRSGSESSLYCII